MRQAEVTDMGLLGQHCPRLRVLDMDCNLLTTLHGACWSPRYSGSKLASPQSVLAANRRLSCGNSALCHSQERQSM